MSNDNIFKVTSDMLDGDGTFGKFVCKPLDRGYGITLGNSLRRILLSSLEGVAIPEDAKPVTKEAIVLCGFDRSAAGELLEAIKRGKLKHVPLKAMLTPNNISWTLRTVLYELNEEHEQFKKMGSK